MESKLMCCLLEPYVECTICKDVLCKTCVNKVKHRYIWEYKMHCGRVGVVMVSDGRSIPRLVPA